MKTDQASKYFMNGLNCTQSVLKAFQKEFNVSEKRINKASLEGGGMAENGLCGALHAIKIMTPDDTFSEVEKSFFSVAGSSKCHEIRRKNSLSCFGCVHLATEKLESLIQKRK
jgi:hypothetical protein